MAISIEREYIFPTLRAAANAAHERECYSNVLAISDGGFCDCNVGKAWLALSFYTDASGFSFTASAPELAAVLGTSNWVVARHSHRIVERYGADVVCLSPEKYDEAQRKAIRARAEKMGVRWP